MSPNASDALRSRKFDQVVLCTLPRDISRWLRLSLPHRLRRTTDISVLHVTAHPRQVRRSSRPRELSRASS